MFPFPPRQKKSSSHLVVDNLSLPISPSIGLCVFPSFVSRSSQHFSLPAQLSFTSYLPTYLFPFSPSPLLELVFFPPHSSFSAFFRTVLYLSPSSHMSPAFLSHPLTTYTTHTAWQNHHVGPKNNQSTLKKKYSTL